MVLLEVRTLSSSFSHKISVFKDMEGFEGEFAIK
jgi:hypothetical protein